MIRKFFIISKAIMYFLEPSNSTKKNKNKIFEESTKL